MNPPPVHLVFHIGAGGASGFGHLSRCRALAHAARERGWVPTFVVETSAPETLPSDSGFAWHLAPTREDALSIRGRLSTSPRTIVVCDLPDRVAPTGGPAPIVLLNGDPARPEPADLVFLRGATTPDGETPGTVRTGFTYEVVRPEITDLRPPTPWAGTAVGDILVSFGASDPGEQTEALLAATVPLAGLHVMIGPGFTRERRARIEGLLAGRGSVLDDPDAFAPLLAETDCFVSVGGQSVLEALHLGRPVAAVRWGSLADDVTWLSDAGLVADLGPADGALEQLATLMARPDVLAQHARAGFATIDAQGANRCLDAIATELLDTGLGDRLPTD